MKEFLQKIFFVLYTLSAIWFIGKDIYTNDLSFETLWFIMLAIFGVIMLFNLFKKKEH